jgi:hypothetical protein
MTVEKTVARVLQALPPGPSPTVAGASLLAVVSAWSTPDLASRVRRDLGGAGIVIEDMGLGSAGRHTVVTFPLPAPARPELERLAERSRWSLSFLDPSDLGASVA